MPALPQPPGLGPELRHSAVHGQRQQVGLELSPVFLFQAPGVVQDLLGMAVRDPAGTQMGQSLRVLPAQLAGFKDPAHGSHVRHVQQRADFRGSETQGQGRIPPPRGIREVSLQNILDPGNDPHLLRRCPAHKGFKSLQDTARVLQV